MKRSTLCAVVFAALCFLAWPQTTQAQYYCGGGTAYGISIITYDDQTHGVYAYSGTELDYCAGVYYDPYVEGYLYEGRLTEFLSDAVDSDYGYGYADIYPAEAFTGVRAKPSTRYIIKSYHYVVAYYNQYGCFSPGCGYYWYDPWGYYFSGGDYGGGYNFWGYYNPGYYTRQYYYLGSTMIDITTPYFCTGTSNPDSFSLFFNAAGNVSTCPLPPSAADLNVSGPPGVVLAMGSAQPGGLPFVNTVQLRAEGTPGGGTYTWSTASQKVELVSGANSAVVTVKAKAKSDRADDVRINILYVTPGGTRIEGYWDLTVHQPTRMDFYAVVENSNKADASCSDPNSRNYLANSSGWEKQVVWKVMDHLGNQIKGPRLPITSTTNPYPGQNAGKFKGILATDKEQTSRDGFWTHHYHWCSTKCGRGETDVVRTFQRYVVNGFTMPDIDVTFECRQISVQGDGTRPGAGAPVRKTVGLFTQYFWLASLAVDTTDSERQYWTDRITNAQAQGQPQLLAEARTFGRALFQSAEYAALNRTDEDFVSDLYWSYLQRAPDESGYNFWLSVLRDDNARGINGREHLIQGFEHSDEFRVLLESLEAGSQTVSCDTVQEQNCYNQGGWWDSTNCSCTIIEEPPPDPCYYQYGYSCY